MRHFAAAVLTVLVLFAWADPAHAFKLKLGTLAPEGSPWHEIIRDMAAEWKEASGGEVDVRIYPGGIAGDDRDMVRKMRVGQLHAAVLTGEGLSEISNDVMALQMPLVLRTDGELDYVMEQMAPRLEKALDAKGFKVLSWGYAGWVRLFSKQPVLTPTDRKSLRLFTWAGDPAYEEAWKRAGFQPVALQVTEMHTALQSGLINSFTATSLAALSFQWFGQAKHMMDMSWGPLVGATIVSKRAWNKIPDELKPKLAAIAAEAGARMKSETRRLDAEAVDAMREHGLQVHAVAPEMIPVWEAIAATGNKSLVGTVVPHDAAAEVLRLRDEFRARQ